MVKARLQLARNLIKRGRYGAARMLLLKIDDPSARSWLEQLDAVEAKQKRATKSTDETDYADACCGYHRRYGDRSAYR